MYVRIRNQTSQFQRKYYKFKVKKSSGYGGFEHGTKSRTLATEPSPISVYEVLWILKYSCFEKFRVFRTMYWQLRAAVAQWIERRTPVPGVRARFQRWALPLIFNAKS